MAHLETQRWGLINTQLPNSFDAVSIHKAMFHSATTGELFAVTCAGTETTTDLSGDHTLGTNAKFGVPVLAVSVEFLIDDVVVATHTTNLPTTNLRPTLGLHQGSAGTERKITEIDYFVAHQLRNAP